MLQKMLNKKHWRLGKPGTVVWTGGKKQISLKHERVLHRNELELDDQMKRI